MIPIMTCMLLYGNVLEGLALKQCQEIHAVIDEHGKAFAK